MRTTLRTTLLAATVALLALAAGLEARASSTIDSLLSKGGLDKALSQQLGLTKNQSQGGLGAMLGLAKEKLDSGNYDKFAAMVPGADKYLKKAKKLGLLDGKLGNMAGLNQAFAKLGISEDKAAKIVPTVTDMLGKVGGDEVKGMLSSFLG
jgi:hypothetical protein